MPFAPRNVPVVPLPAVIVDPVPVVVEFVVLFTTGPVALPVWIATVNWSPDWTRLPLSALLSDSCGNDVFDTVQRTLANDWVDVAGLGKTTV